MPIGPLSKYPATGGATTAIAFQIGIALACAGACEIVLLTAFFSEEPPDGFVAGAASPLPSQSRSIPLGA